MKILIKNLKVRTEVGAFASEKGVKQDIIINIEYKIDGAAAAKEDKLKNTVNYHPLTDKIIAQVETNTFNIIEYLASFILDIVMSYDKRIKKAKVRVDKPGALKRADCASVEVSAER